MTLNQDHLMELIGRFARDIRTQVGGYALCAQASEAAIRKTLTPTRLTRLRRITATPCNLVFQARRS
jgi:hypothetical protein